MPTIIDVLKEEYSEIVSFLGDSKQTSLQNNAERHFEKLLALSISSYFEHEIQQILITFVSSVCADDPRIISILKQKAVSRQYHTYFQWEVKGKPGQDANNFFGLFGDDFKDSAKSDVKKDTDLDESIKSFIELGYIRNALVHRNFASYPLEKTTTELYGLYEKAVYFVNYLKEKLKCD